MRTEERWNEVLRENCIKKKFPPRIQQILLTIPEPIDLPKPIQSTYLFGEHGYGKTIRAAFMLLEEEKQLYLHPEEIDFSKFLVSTEENITWQKQEELEQEEASQNRECVFITMSDLLNKIKDTYDKKVLLNEQKLLRYYSNAHLLVLDDLGTEMPTDWMLHILYSIINHRYDY